MLTKFKYTVYRKRKDSAGKSAENIFKKHLEFWIAYFLLYYFYINIFFHYLRKVALSDNKSSGNVFFNFVRIISYIFRNSGKALK